MVAERWLQGESPIPVPTSAPVPMHSRKHTKDPQHKRRKITSHTITPNPQQTVDLVTHISAPHNTTSSIQKTTVPKRITLHPSTRLSTQTINPERDAIPESGDNTYQAFLVTPEDDQPEPMVRICDPHGKSVSPKDLTQERYNFLISQHAKHADTVDANQDIANLLRRYHPKARTLNPQGRVLDLSNH